MEALIGMVPPEPEENSKERVAVGAPYTWIVANFARYLQDANDDVI